MKQSPPYETLPNVSVTHIFWTPQQPEKQGWSSVRSQQYYPPDSSHGFSTTFYVGAEFSHDSLLQPNCKTEPTKFSVVVSVTGEVLHIIIFVTNLKICYKKNVSLLSSTSFLININFIILLFFYIFILG